ncbi:MAG: hypothetical protein AB7K78_22410, partial [Xanthobacteraceae bacterium]
MKNEDADQEMKMLAMEHDEVTAHAAALHPPLEGEEGRRASERSDDASRGGVTSSAKFHPTPPRSAGKFTQAV